MGHKGVYSAKMIRLLLVCSALVAAGAEDSTAAKPATGSNPNTRIFGLGNLVGGALGALGGALGGHGHHQGGFNQGHHGVVNPGFNQGYNFQGGFQGGFPGVGIGGGFNPGIGGAIVNPGHGTGVIGGGGSASCRRWCRTPQGQAYCCEGANEPISAAITKQGQCPPVRPSCPPTRFGQPPRQCSSDGGCAGFDKCCFDTCLQHHTCKPPIGLGRK